MQEFNSRLFGSIPEPESLADLLELAAAPPPGRPQSRVRMWRGQADLDLPLHSGAYRRVGIGSRQVTEEDVAGYEERLLSEATHRGYRQLDGRTLSDLELLARLQHHGAATRLLDFTRNSLVAIHFCASSQPAKHGALIGVHTDCLGGSEMEPWPMPYGEILKLLRESDHPLTWQPTDVTPRVAAQHSQFLFSKIVQDPKGSLALPSNPHTLVVACSPQLKKEARTFLAEVCDITNTTLFPDIDGFCAARGHRVGEWSTYRW